MTLEDWRNASEGEVAALYGRARARWSSLLAWDSTPTWVIAEQGRIAGRLPGLLARDASGDVLGWGFFATEHGTLRIGALDGVRADVVRDLLDGLLDTPEAALCSRYEAFLFPETRTAAAALERRRFRVQPYLYLERPLGESRPPCAAAVRTWREDDTTAAVRLLARSYAGTAAATFFAPNARMDEWARYLVQLLHTPVCGTFSASESFVLDHPDGSRPIAMVLTTWVAAETAHIAQIVVDPETRGAGLGRCLVEACTDAAAARQARRLTLLVAEDNVPARRLYERLGFVERARFVSASRARVTRVTRRPAHRGEPAVPPPSAPDRGLPGNARPAGPSAAVRA